MSQSQPRCRVCGWPTRSKYGVCCRTRLCCRVARRFARTGRFDMRERAPLPPPRPCKVCGQATSGRFGICGRTAACRNEVVCHRMGYTTRLLCAGCGGPMRSHCRWRYCTRTRQCRALRRSEMLRIDSERIRANNRRSGIRHAEQKRQRELLKRRLRGVRPLTRGQHHPSWAGGRVVFCIVCGQCAGWRKPYWLRRRSYFLCKEHGRESWKQNLGRRLQPRPAIQRVPEAGANC